jgi:Domain of unknown function (DUF4382)
MMAAKFIGKLALILTGLGLAGCTGTVKSSQKLGQPLSANSTGTVSMFLRATKASGTAAFTMVVSGLSAMDSSGNPVSLLNTVEVPEVRHLELAPAMLSQATMVPQGHFQSIFMTLANPEISVVDAQGNVTVLTGSTTPSVKLATSTVAISSLPGLFSVTARGNTEVMMDFDLERSISRDGAGNYVITPWITGTQMSTAQPEESLVDDIGTITTVSSGSAPVLNMNLQSSGSNVTVDTNGETLWSADITQLSNLQAGQSVEITADMESSGSYLAKFVGSSTAEMPTTYEGLLTKTTQDSSGNTSFTVVVQR